MTGSGEALLLAARDLYANSWRLVPLNALLGALLVAVGVCAVAVHAALVLVVLAGPIAAALVHCAVVVVRTGNLSLADALDGLRLHWRRGLGLAGLSAGTILLVTVAVRFYGGSPLAWPLVFLTLYLGILLGVYQAVLWTLAVAEPERPVTDAARAALELVLRRPRGTAGLGLGLLLVNVAGIAAAVMPFLTLTVAYSFVAVAHFALPRADLEETA